jgi:hypothetical protein
LRPRCCSRSGATVVGCNRNADAIEFDDRRVDLSQQLVASVDLVRALGGGWEDVTAIQNGAHSS